MSKRVLYSIVVPCYNGAKFLDQCLHSIINKYILEQKVTHLYEIIIINDGSKDNSLTIAQTIAREWNQQVRPDFIRVIDKANGQYGSVINLGLKLAQGIYFKVLDVDDTFNTDSFIKILRISSGLPHQVDIIITDHTFEKVGVNKKFLKTFRNFIEPNRIIETRLIALPRDIITMHSIIYRLDFLKDLNYQQSEGIYYSDSEYAIIPLTKVRTFYYIKLPLYRYYLGHEEQSINLKNMVKNQQDQWKVMTKIWQTIDFDALYSKKMTLYMIIALRRLVQWRIWLIVSNPRIKNKRKNLLQMIKHLTELQPKYYKLIFRGALFRLIKITHGYGIIQIMKYGAKIYSKFKMNIIAEISDLG